jgi:hypothetical protein
MFNSNTRHPTFNCFLGVAEEEQSYMVGRQTMKVGIHEKFREDSLEQLKRKTPTDIYINLARGTLAYKHGIKLDLIFTDKTVYDKFRMRRDTPSQTDDTTDQVSSGRPEPDIKINKVLNIDFNRSNRTILEVKFKGFENTMVLKCVDFRLKDIVDKTTETLAQQEIKAYDALPNTIKHLFVEKYAHGRIWFDKTSYEVILMEQMFPVDLEQAFLQTEYKIGEIVQLKWMAKAFELLHEIHQAGYSHGDPHAGNILWTDGIGLGKMKFIDIERMFCLKLGDIDNETKAIRKLSDIGYLLFRNQLIYQGIINIDPEYDFEINCKLLHARLRRIKSNLPRDTVFLDETLPYTNDFINAGVWSTAISKSMWEDSNPSQYKKMATDEFGRNLDIFISKMSDPAYLEKVFHYTIMEINRSELRSSGIDEQDMNAPYFNQS